MRRRRIHLALPIEHAPTQRQKKQEPAVNFPVEDVAADQSSNDQEEEQIKQVQIAHRLKGPQTLEAWGKHDDEPDGSLEDAIIKKSRHQGRQGGAVSISAKQKEPAEDIQKDQGREDSQPLIPVPAGQEIKGARRRRLPPSVGRGFEDPSQR